MTRKEFFFRTRPTCVYYSSLNKILHIQMVGVNTRFHHKSYCGRITNRAQFRCALRACFYGLMASDVPASGSLFADLSVVCQNQNERAVSHG
jgi:hypothetical protein